jgi:hypothetical protein
MRIYWRDFRPMVDWGHLGARRFTEPFFAQTIAPCVRHPADLLFRHQTALDDLGDIAGSQPGLRPTGFIFHMSRCGSTLISQMLAAAPENIVISEAAPIDDILRANFRDPGVTEERRVQWLQWLVDVMGWRRHPAEKHVFIKFDCWHVMFLPLIQRAFPGVPWIFVYREPAEVMASHLRHRGAQMIPEVLEPGVFGWDLPTIGQMALNEYGARVLAKICDTGLAHARDGNGKLLNYHQLPDAIWPALMGYWKVKFSPDQTTRMLAAAQLNAKNPVLPFEPDNEAKRESLTSDLRDLTSRWLDEVYQQLETRRRTQGFA